ncbi:MAG: sulfatase/phosphatase domain-containing protein, partial [Myxococcota bacterium]
DHGKLGHGHTLYDELIHGPLLIRFPSRVPAGQVVEDPVELVDISPTVLELADIEPSKEHEGLSLVPLMEGRAVARPYYTFSEFLDNQRAIRVGDWKLIGSAASWSKLFNIRADPGEQTNMVKQAPLARRMCEIHVTEALGNVDKRTRMIATRVGRKYKAGNVEMDPELKKQLEALGYFHDE